MSNDIQSGVEVAGRGEAFIDITDNARARVIWYRRKREDRGPGFVKDGAFDVRDGGNAIPPWFGNEHEVG